MSFNRFSYANNNPYKYVDPDGRESNWFGNLFKSATEVAREEARAKIKAKMKEGGKEAVRKALREGGLREQDICTMEKCPVAGGRMSQCQMENCAEEFGLVSKKDDTDKKKNDDEQGEQNDEEKTDEEKALHREVAEEIIREREE